MKSEGQQSRSFTPAHARIFLAIWRGTPFLAELRDPASVGF